MSEPAFGDNVTRLFDPDTSNHYAFSEDAQLELRQLFRALDAVATLADTPPDEDGPEVNPRHLAPLFFTLARHGERIMAEAKTRHPRSVGRKPR